MRNLADTISRLAANRNRSLGHAPAGADRLVDMARFGTNPGELDARLYVPAGLQSEAPLVVVLHGCTQTAAAYDHASGWSRLADRHGFAVLYPQQRRSNNANLCFNWFVPEDIRRDAGEAMSIRQMVEAVAVSHGVDRNRIFVTGLSAGGAMASAMLATYPDVFAGGAIIAGLPHGVASTVPEAFDRMRGHGMPGQAELQRRLAQASGHAGPWPRVSVWHGSADRTVASSNALLTVGQWLGVHGAKGSPTRQEKLDGHRRLVWSDAAGRDAIEYFVIEGMGHGTPLDAADGLSHSAPYMLDAGISSTMHIARFWELLPANESSSSAPIRSAEEVSVANIEEIEAQGVKRPLGSSIHEGPGGVRQIIEDALRKAGLTK